VSDFNIIPLIFCFGTKEPIILCVSKRERDRERERGERERREKRERERERES
jgi:hypothetical protein